MSKLLEFLPSYLSGLAGMSIALVWAAWRLEASRKKLRPPQEDDLLRPPGYSLAQQLEEHQTKWASCAAILFIGSAIAGGAVWITAVMLNRVVGDAEVRGAIAE